MNTTKPKRRGGTRIISISLHDVPHRKLLQLARPERNRSRSRTVERLIDAEWSRRYGL